MTTWYGHFPLSHPWMPSRKRKLSNCSDFDPASASDVESQPLSSPSLKRRRYDLARNLSQLSLFEQAYDASPSYTPSMFQDTSLSSSALDAVTLSTEPPMHAPMDADSDEPLIDLVPPIVEEPGDDPNPALEVRMRNTSSYEPEKDRIVITDLDSSEDEADTSPDTSDGNSTHYSVSPALLSRMKASKFTMPLVKSPCPLGGSDPTRALVLFNPSPWNAKDSRELEGIYHVRDWERDARELVVTEVVNADTDAMEIE